MPKHLCARGRIALSGVDLRPQGPGGGSKRTSFRRLPALNSRKGQKSRKLPSDGAFVKLDRGAGPCKIETFGANRVMTSSGETFSRPISDHFDGRQFFDPDGAPPKSLRQVLRWQLFSGRL